MRFLHAMMRVRDLDASLAFFCGQLGLKEVRRRDHEKGRFTLVFLETGKEGDAAQLELTYNWDQEEPYGGGRNFGHLAFEVDDISALCTPLQESRVTILPPPSYASMAFVRTPDDTPLQLPPPHNHLPPPSRPHTMPSTGEW